MTFTLLFFLGLILVKLQRSNGAELPEFSPSLVPLSLQLHTVLLSFYIYIKVSKCINFSMYIIYLMCLFQQAIMPCTWIKNHNYPSPQLCAQGLSSILIVPPALNFGLPFYVSRIEFEGI